MTREQIEQILKTSGAKSDNEGGHTLPEGSIVTFHIGHQGASLAISKVESVRFEAELIYAKSPKQVVGLVTGDVFAVTVEGASGQPARRPAGFSGS